ncbi:hypothetical protein BGW38_008808 [Lunasporangiospora selenospora]|uniref:Peptidase S59 domain-containing protein n=1 Tax=Lunasporangiospora selenospora TaxID=979761 RepID=A0A9P6G2R9_9FUNG|nr:hypothetical protein BGW38_008808 [Lunasporangiospora selenospora]
MYGAGFSGGGFGGQQQQQQPGSGFGAAPNTFGSTSFGGASTGFGATGSTGFGQAAQQQTPFGAAPSAGGFGGSTGAGFGASGGFGASSGFGAQQQSQSGFGSTSFGGAGPSTSTGFGGFGTSTAGATGGFGANTGFGAKPAAGFGAQPSTGFGATANTGFGGGGFGNNAGMLGGGMNTAAGNGTMNPPFTPYIEKEQTTGQNSHYQSITAMPAYRNFSFEELRLQDYQQGRKSAGQAAGFGAATPGFGQQPQQPAAGFGAQPAPGFGAGNTTSGIGGFGAGTTGFGAAPTAGGFGAGAGFGATPVTSTPFGGQPAAPAPLFGAAQQQPAFGAPGATGFGAAAGTTGFGASSAFGAGAAAKPAAGFGAFGTPATSQPAAGFGAAATPFGAAPATASLFGGGATSTGAGFGVAPASTATPFGAFGTTPATSAPAATSLFGGGAATGPFGAAKPAATSLFGAAPAASTAAPAFGGFGTTPAAGAGSLFGSTPASSSLFPATSAPATGLFGGGTASGVPAFGMPAASTSLFGASKPAAAGGLFSQAPTTGFGMSTFGTGATAAPLFGQAGAPTTAFGTSAFGTGLLGSSTATAATAAQPTMVASVNGNIYGDNPLFQRDAAAAAAKPQPAILSRSAPAQKLPALIPPVRFNPRHSHIRLRAASSATFSSSVNAGSDLAAGRKSLLLLDGASDGPNYSSNDYAPSRSVKKLELKPRGQDSAQQDASSSAHKTSVTFNPSLESSTTGASKDRSTSAPQQNGDAFESRNAQPSSSAFNRQATSPLSSTSGAGKRASGEYWMLPSLEELRKMSRSQLQRVENFKVGLPDYGSVDFLDPVDLTTVPSLSSICGEIVIFKPRICQVYPDEHNKPPRGQGLNVPAMISLERCWPLDKSTLEPIRFDKSSPQYNQHMKRLRRQRETEFVDFNLENGTWTFKVEHFSEYGLNDDDEEEEKATQETGRRTVQNSREYESTGVDRPKDTTQNMNNNNNASRSRSDQSPFARSMTKVSRDRDPQRQNMMRHSLFGESASAQDRNVKRSSVWSNSSDASAQSDVAARPLDDQGAEIRPSFQEEYEPQESNYLTRPPRKFTRTGYEQSLLSRKGALLADAGLMMGRSCRVGWGPNGMLAVCGRICNFNDVKERKSDKSVKAAVDQDCGMGLSSTTVELVKVKAVAQDGEEELERHIVALQAQLQNTEIILDQSNQPRAIIAPGTSFTSMMNSLKGLQHNLSTEEVYAWILAQSLFDEQLKTAEVEAMSESSQEAFEAIGRRVRCGTWLSHVTKPSLDTAMAEIASRGGPSALEETIFSLLVNNKKQKASICAVQSRNLRLATLISQTSKGSKTMSDIEDQLALYRDARALDQMPEFYVKVYALLCGALRDNLAPTGQAPQYVTDGLDWRRTFGLFLWYNNSEGTHLAEAVGAYVKAVMSNPDVARPLPWYKVQDQYQTMDRDQDMGQDKGQPWKRTDHHDFIFQLLSLATESSACLEVALHPLGISPSRLDYRLSWQFYMVLVQSLGMTDCREESTHAKICQDVIFQLENQGLWEWAVFVALHLEEVGSRELVIRRLLEQHVDLPSFESVVGSATESTTVDNRGVNTRTMDNKQKCMFVLKYLRVPEEWLWKARATKAKYNGDLVMEVVSLLKGGEHQSGHALILSSLAPVCILRRDLQTLRRLLAMVNPAKVSQWEQGGRIYQAYLDCCSAETESQIERLRWVKGQTGGGHGNRVSYSEDLVSPEVIMEWQGQLQELLRELPLLMSYKSSDSQYHEISVTEMASKCTTLLRDLKDLSIQESASLTELPLTEDQRMCTVQKNSTDYFDEILSMAETSAY